MALVVVAIIALIKVLGLDDGLNLESLQENMAKLHLYYREHTAMTLFLFGLFYTTFTALALPGAGILTLGAGALLGRWHGTILVSFVSTIGATVAFLMARFFFRDFIQSRWKQKLATLNKGIEQEGWIYLLTLRLIPLFPFFLINLAMGVTKIKTVTFFFVSQLGMLPGTFVFINAGQELSKITSVESIFSPRLIFSLSLLGLVPVVIKKILHHIQLKRPYRRYRRPRSFDYDMATIGGGAAGLVTSYITTTLKAKAALIEQTKMGGDCLNTGCVPSKTLIRAAKMAHQSAQWKKFQRHHPPIEEKEEKKDEVNFSQVMDHIQAVIKKIEPHDSVERYTELGVDCFKGTAKIISPWEIEVNGKIITTRFITVASGARPFTPPLKGLSEIDYLVSDNLWKLTEQPQRLVVLGGGPIGVEMAQSFSRLGSEVFIVEKGPRLLTREDPEAAHLLQKKLESEGIHCLTGYDVVEVAKRGKQGEQGEPLEHKELICQREGKETKIPFDELLVAVGRKARTKGFGLEELGVKLNPNGTIEVNQWMQTNFSNIYACGDVTGPYQFTHMASHQAWYCAVNALLGRLKKFKVDYSTVPRATYTDPCIASVGATLQELKKNEIDHEVVQYELNDLDRAICDGHDDGFVKVFVSKKGAKILGAVIVGNRADDLIMEFNLAMKHGLSLNKILSTIHPYPTMSEANKFVAGQWRKKHQPQKVLACLKKIFQRLRRE